jgi:protein arginine N-methyltransferase 1
LTYSVYDYCTMIADRPRAEAFDAALRKTVKSGDAVLDIGTGTGVFALLALRYGARKVYAIEPNPAIDVARRLARANGVSDRVVFIEGLSTEVELPERADVIVSDIRGAMPLYRAHLPAIVDARKRHLAAGGTLLPRSDTLRVVPVATAEAWEQYVGQWRGHHFGLDTAPLEEVLANSLHAGRQDGVLPLAEPRAWGVLDYATVTSPSLRGDAAWTLEQAGTLYGYHLWFDMDLAEGISLTNAPDRPHLIYGSVFLALPKPLELAAGDRLSVRLLADLVGEEYIWRWETEATGPERPRTRLRQSTLLGSLVSLDELSRREAGHVPVVSETAVLDHEILGALAAGTALGEIARDVAARYPERFADWHRALAYVSDLYLRYADRKARVDAAPDRSGT